MRWGFFLHFYQPANQSTDVLNALNAQCYKPLFSFFKHSKSRLSVNISGTLFDLWEKNRDFSIIDDIRSCVSTGTMEVTGSAKYHCFLPLLPDTEIERQIVLNNETLRYYLGKDVSIQGFFPPEMGYDPKLVPIIEHLGFKWIIMDEIGYTYGNNSAEYPGIHIPSLEKSNVKVFFRNRRLSNLIMSAVTRSVSSTLRTIKVGGFESENRKFIVSAMDGETFGHHRPGLENLLFKLMNTPTAKLCSLSDLLLRYSAKDSVSPISCTWASSNVDIQEGNQFLSWKDSTNLIHTYQWELVSLVLKITQNMSGMFDKNKHVRSLIDEALASDHFWWASAKPWWSIEMIESGAFKLLNIVRMCDFVSDDVKNRALELYQLIISTAFDWQRSGYIKKLACGGESSIARIPFKERTLDKGGQEAQVYEAFKHMLRTLEKKSARHADYEQAILWRDALYKIESKLDIYDAIHAIDLLRQHIPHEKVEEMLDKYTGVYKKIRGGQPEQRGR